MTSLDLLPLGAMLFAGCTMAGSNLAMRAVTRGGGRALRVSLALFIGALMPLAVIYLLGRPALAPLALGIGAVSGGAAFASGVAALIAMRYGKVGPSILLQMMGAAGPVLVSAMLGWDAGMSGMTALGLALALAAMLLCTLRREAEAGNRWVWAAWAFAAFVLNAINQTGQKLLSVAGLQGESLAFNLAYFTAGIAVGGLAGPLLAREPTPAAAVRAREWVVGVGFGLLIALQMFAILYAVSHLSAAIAFPTLAVLPLVLAALGAGALFRERLSGTELAGIVLACVSLVLLNL